MPWVEVFAVSHLVGDYLLQTEWQALNKRGGLTGTPTMRRALVSHAVSYTVAFVPAFIWLSKTISAATLVALVAGIALPHLIQDDGRLLTSLPGRSRRPTSLRIRRSAACSTRVFTCSRSF